MVNNAASDCALNSFSELQSSSSVDLSETQSGSLSGYLGASQSGSSDDPDATQSVSSDDLDATQSVSSGDLAAAQMDWSMNSTSLTNDSNSSLNLNNSPDLSHPTDDPDFQMLIDHFYQSNSLPDADQDELRELSDMQSDSIDQATDPDRTQSADESFDSTDSLSYDQFQPSSRLGYHPLNSSLNSTMDSSEFFVSF